MHYKSNKQLAREWHESHGILKSRDFYNTFLADDFTADMFGQQLNKDQYINQEQMFAQAFNDSTTVIEEQIIEDDKVVTRITWNAIHISELFGIPASGLPILIKGVIIDHFKNGKCIKHYPLFDTAQLFRRQVIREKVRSQISRDLHDNIGSTLGSISYYSELAEQLAGEEPSQLKTLLQKIVESSRSLVDEMSDIVWAINPANNTFEKLTTRMKSYAGELFAARDIDFAFETNNVPQSTSFSTEHRKNIFLIFKEATYNAAKYSGCSHFHAHLQIVNNTFSITLSDNGKGFDINRIASYNGNGIINMRHRAAEINSRFAISSDRHGTHICLEVPVRES